MAWVLDLDGVVWLAEQPIAGAAEAVGRLRGAGHRVLFVSNNSSQPLATVEGKLARFGIPAAGDVLTSAMAAARLVEPGERALVVNTGYFSDRMALLLERYGAEVVQARCAPGEVPDVAAVEALMASGRFKVMTVTHVDTSTGVLARTCTTSAPWRSRMRAIRSLK